MVVTASLESIAVVSVSAHMTSESAASDNAPVRGLIAVSALSADTGAFRRKSRST